jgi:hypothetical protein
MRDARPQGRERGGAGHSSTVSRPVVGSALRARLYRALRRAQPGPRLRGTRPDPPFNRPPSPSLTCPERSRPYEFSTFVR